MNYTEDIMSMTCFVESLRTTLGPMSDVNCDFAIDSSQI